MQSSNHSIGKIFHMEAIDPTFSEDQWEVVTFGPCAVYSKQLNNNMTRPDLFVIADISNKSFMETSHVIMNTLYILEKKYHSVHIIKFCYANSNINTMQDAAYAMRDEIKLDEKYVTIEPKTAYGVPKQKWVSNRTEVFKPVNDLNILCAKLVNHIITNMIKLTNIEVLGNCEVSSIAIHIVTMNPIYNALYLLAPKSPHYIEPLKKLDKYRLLSMKFYFGLSSDANDDKSIYDNMMDQFNITKYRSRIYSDVDICLDMIYDICLY